MNSNYMQSLGLGEVIELARVPKTPIKNVHDPVFITDKKLVPSIADTDLYRKSDVDDSLQSGDPYTEYATTTEDISIGSIDACSPFVASLGAGSTKIQVYSVFANSEYNAPTIQASQTGLKKVFLNKENKLTYQTNMAWTVVSNGFKFFAYPINTTVTPTITCRTSTDGVNWAVETLSGSYPTRFSHPSSARWYYNTPSSGYGIIPNKIPTSDIHAIGTNFFLFDNNKLHKSTDGLAWIDITTQTFGNTEKPNMGFFIGINGTTAFIANSYGIKYTEDSGNTFSAVDTFLEPTSYGFVENKTIKSKFLANNTTPDNLFYVTTNTGKTWRKANTTVNANCIMYRGSSIIILEKNSSICKTSSDDGVSFVDTSFPTNFSYPIRTGVCTPNAFYIKDADFKVYRSTDGVSWTYCCTYALPDNVFDFGISPNGTTDIIFSNDPTGKYPYLMVYNSGANTTCAKIGEVVSSVICPSINSNTAAFGCNSVNKYGIFTTLTDLQTPPYTKLSSVKIPSSKSGVYPYIRIG